MGQITATFDGGVNGASATAGDSTVGASFFALNGGSATYSSTNRLGSSGCGLTLVSVAGTQCIGRWFATSPSTKIGISVGVSLSSAPAGEITLASLRGASLNVRWTASNTIRIYHSSTNLGVIASGLVPGVMYRVYVGVDTISGDISAAVYQNTSTTPSSPVTNLSGLSLAGSSIDSFDIGVVTPAADSTTAYIDALYVTDGSMSDPSSAGSATVVNHSKSSNRCIVDFRSSVSGTGSSLSHSISPSTGIVEPIEGLFLIPQSSSIQIYTVTTTDSGDGSATTTTVTVPAADAGQDALRVRTKIGNALV